MDLSALGRSGLIAYGGQVQGEWLPELRGDRGRKIIREMADSDAVIGACLLAFEMLMRQMDWRVDAATEDPKDIEAGEFVESCREDMSSSWADTLSEILTFLPFGWSWLEQVYKKRGGDTGDGESRSKFSDGKIGWRKWSLRAQESLLRWQFSDDGGIESMVQTVPGSPMVTIPIEKSLLFRTTARKGNPEGRSILRTAYRAWYFQRHIEEIEGIGIERDLAGIPVGYLPSSILNDADASEPFKKLITTIRRNEQEGVLWPSDMDAEGHPLFKLELLSTGGTRQFDTNEIINRYDSRKAMSMLADVIMIGHESVGSHALADSKTDLLGYAIGSFADSVCDVVNSHAIPRLLRLNGMSTENPPKLMHGDVESANLVELGDYIQKLSMSGMALFPNAKLEQKLLEVASLPAPEEDATLAPRAKPQRSPVQNALVKDSTAADFHANLKADLGQQ